MFSNDELARPLGAYALSRTRPTTREGYADPEFWDTRFKETESSYDWYVTYEELEELFDEFCPPSPTLNLLMVGCGTSELPAQLHGAGFRRITNIDISPAVIVKMEARSQGLGLVWRAMDATQMTFDDCCFDVAIDKGTLDAMMCGDVAVASAMVAEVWRTLVPGGIFILVSHNGLRRGLLDSAVQRMSPCDAGARKWTYLEIKKCRLSAQATLINIMRAKLKGRPMVEAFKDPVLLAESMKEARKTVQQMRFLEAFQKFKKRKELMAAARARKAGGAPLAAGGAVGTAGAMDGVGGSQDVCAPAVPASQPEDASEAEEEEDRPAADPLRQPFCWTYVLQKPQQSSQVVAECGSGPVTL